MKHTHCRSPYGWSVDPGARPNWREFLSPTDLDRVKKIDRETGLKRDPRRDKLRAKAWPLRQRAIKQMKETINGDR